jgi:hypothetical protein
MAHVRPSWQMGGFCLMIFYLSSSKRMSSFVPAPLEVAEVVPGVTLSGLYAASYATGEFGALGELSAFPALVRYKKKKGFYIPCSMVESRAGSFGDKGAWGLRNEAAVFEWSQESSRYVLKVGSGVDKILEIHLNARKISLPIRVSFPFFHLRNSGVVSYRADYAAKVHLSASTVEIPEKSPLNVYGLKNKVMTTFWDSTKIVLHPPESEKIVIGQGVSEGIYHVRENPFEPAGVKKSSEEYRTCRTLL